MRFLGDTKLRGKYIDGLEVLAIHHQQVRNGNESVLVPCFVLIAFDIICTDKMTFSGPASIRSLLHATLQVLQNYLRSMKDISFQHP
eukprot:6214597-Pleurochrysis_carterae.AAC.1